MTHRSLDPLVDRIRRWSHRVCPPAIQERLVDQALADLADERTAARSGVGRQLLTFRGVARLLLALVLSVVVLRRQWRDARWWPEPVFTREAFGWITLLTLVLVLRAGLARPFPARSWVLLPDFVMLHLVPLAVPTAAFALALVLRRRRAASTAVLAIAAAVVSVVLTVSVPSAIRHMSAEPDAVSIATQQVDANGRTVRIAAWQRFHELRREQWGRYSAHKAGGLVAFCLLLPVLASLTWARFRLEGRVGVVLVIVLVVQELLFRWSTTIPPPMTPLAEAVTASWLPHIVLAAAIVGLGASLRRRRPAAA